MDSLFQSTSPGQIFYEPEMFRTSCVMEKNNKLLYDPRYNSSGLHTNQWDLQKDSNVFDHLSVQPSYWGTGPTAGNLAYYTVESWNRPTIGWSLQCEQEGNTRDVGYVAAQTDLARYKYVESYRKVGIAFVVLFSLIVCVKGFGTFLSVIDNYRDE